MGTTPIYGFPYPDPSDLVANYPALGQQLAEDIEDVLPTIGGLIATPPTTIANTGGSASTTANVTTFTGVTAISLNGVFGAAYNHYRIIIEGVGSTGCGVQFRFRASGTDNTGSIYDRQFFQVANAATVGAADNNQNISYIGSFGTIQSMISGDIINPFLAKDTNVFTDTRLGGTSIQFFGTIHKTATSFDGITLIPDSGNITGTVSVYGYRK